MRKTQFIELLHSTDTFIIPDQHTIQNVQNSAINQMFINMIDRKDTPKALTQRNNILLTHFNRKQ